MTDNATLARPYAKAAFEAAKTANQLPAWSLALRTLSLIVSDAQIKIILKNPHYSQTRLCELLLGVMQNIANGSETDQKAIYEVNGSESGSKNEQKVIYEVNGSESASDRETQTFKEIKNFIQLLSEKKRLTILPNISDLFEEDCAKESKYMSLNVTSAFLIDDLQRKAVTEKLSKQLNSNLKIDFHVNADLIGGLLVRSRNWVLDDTIKGKLSRLKSALL